MSDVLMFNIMFILYLLGVYNGRSDIGMWEEIRETELSFLNKLYFTIGWPIASVVTLVFELLGKDE